MHKIIKLVTGAILLTAAIYLFVKGIIGWGFLALFVAMLAILLYFLNEYILLAFWQMRKQNIESAKKWLSKIKNKEKQLAKFQYGYYHYMIGLTEAQSNLNIAEKNMKQALKHGLLFGHDRAIAKLNLAAGYMRQGNKKEAKRLLKEAKAEDKQGMVLSQIELMEQQMKKVNVSRNPRQQQMQRRGRYF